MHKIRCFSPVLLSSVLLACTALAQQPTSSSPVRSYGASAISSENATGEAAAVIALDKKIGESIVGGDSAFFEKNTASDFFMTHGAFWETGGNPTAFDTRDSFLKRVAAKSYTTYDLGPVKVEMHGDVALVYGKYIAHIPDRKPADSTWFSCWYEHLYAKRNGAWVYLSHRTVYGPTFGPTRESIQDK